MVVDYNSRSQSKRHNQKRKGKVSAINTNITATIGANAIVHNLRQILAVSIRLSQAPSRISVINDAASLSATKNHIHKTIFFLGRHDETDTVMVTRCTRKFGSQSVHTDAKKGRSCSQLDLPDCGIKALKSARVRITSLMFNATSAHIILRCPVIAS